MIRKSGYRFSQMIALHQKDGAQCCSTNSSRSSGKNVCGEVATCGGTNAAARPTWRSADSACMVWLPVFRLQFELCRLAAFKSDESRCRAERGEDGGELFRAFL